MDGAATAKAEPSSNKARLRRMVTISLKRKRLTPGNRTHDNAKQKRTTALRLDKNGTASCTDWRPLHSQGEHVKCQAQPHTPPRTRTLSLEMLATCQSTHKKYDRWWRKENLLFVFESKRVPARRQPISGSPARWTKVHEWPPWQSRASRHSQNWRKSPLF